MPNPQPFAPLTIIAVLAGIIEASALATLPFLSEDSQSLYTWFLVAFPFFLTALFFLTLNFNHKTFYMPDAPALDNEAQTTPPLHSNQLITLATESSPITVMLSGPDAQSMLRKHVLEALAYPNDTACCWVLVDLDKQQSIQLTLRPLPENTAGPAP
ncbi:hypothetical protein [Pseudomonas sp. Teo4]|uniref:hypothetical protein n=1 Tax=Pseudomonas sp. Teo4 TaxID=3064528 RepID=UPI002ABCBE08|nr:hypothetical protein [Pseudomonas sp. Teo4]MDZ3995780.1 hypothetical protein [Pseudomonas sp. Teo4]